MTREQECVQVHAIEMLPEDKNEKDAFLISL